MNRDVVYYIARRLVALAILLVVISFAVFSLLYIAPGNVVDVLLGLNPRTPETVHALQVKYHLDKSFFEQYWLWAKEAAQFHFGDSIQTTLPVTDEIKTRLPVSLWLGLYAYALTMIIGISLGIVAAFKKRSLLDRNVVAASVIGLSTPAFVSGVFLLYVFAILVPWFPTFGSGSGFVDGLWHLTLPAIALSFTCIAYVVKHTRAALINVIDADYMTFARARGLSSRRVLLLYGLRNALIPVITIAAPLLAYVITGAVLVEVTFSLPGIGQMLVQSATVKDLPMLQGIAILIAVLIMVANLLADLIYVVVDPRIRLARKR
jgi:peptide/nickel transport system permease protein